MNRPKTRYLLPCGSYLRLFVFLGLAWAGGVVSSTPAWGQPGGAAAPVVVSKVYSTNQASSQSFVGTLVPIRKSVVGSAVDGRVVAIHVDNGDAVSMVSDQVDDNQQPRGQAIVQLRTVSLDIEIAAAEVELKIRQNAEEELKQSLPTEIEAATAAINEIKARMTYSKADYERLRELAEKSGGIPRREIEEAFSNYGAQVQTHIAAKAALQKLKATREVRLSQAKSRVDAQRAEIQRLQELKDMYTIRTPFAGYVTSKMTELGEWVSRGDDVMEIVTLDPIELRINVPQNYVGRLQKSLDESRQTKKKYLTQVSIEAIPGQWVGEVIRIVPQADLRSRSFPVIIRIANPNNGFGHTLKSGMLATASMFVGREERILLVKKDALVLGGRSTSLYVVDTNPTDGNASARPVTVQTGASIGDWIQVIGALNEGERVVIEGNERLRPGQAVQVIKENTETLPLSPAESAN